MLIEINLEKISGIEGMDCNRYTILHLLFYNKREWLDRLNLLNYDDLLWLQNNEYIMMNNSTSDTLIIRPKAEDIFEPINNFNTMWIEFCNAFPFKVPDGHGGYRILRALDPDAKTNSKAKNRYKSVVKNKTHHELIIQCLEKQKEFEKHKLQYFQNIDTWIYNRTWEKYVSLLEEKPTVVATNDYGKDI